METANSKRFAIISIITALIVGSTPMFNVSPILSFAMGGAVLVCIGFLIYFWNQAVYVRGLRCYYKDVPSGESQIIIVEGFVKAKNRDGLQTIELSLPSGRISLHDSASNMPDFHHEGTKQVNNYYEEFKAGFSIKTRKSQDASLVFILGEQYMTKSFTIPTKQGEKMNSQKLKKVGRGVGVSKKQFHNLLKKASNPFKKSEKGKS